jgi:hypothetical protein
MISITWIPRTKKENFYCSSTSYGNICWDNHVGKQISFQKKKKHPFSWHVYYLILTRQASTQSSSYTTFSIIMYYKSEEIELKGDYKYVWSSKRGDVNIISVSLSRLLHVVVIHTHTHTHTQREDGINLEGTLAVVASKTSLVIEFVINGELIHQVHSLITCFTLLSCPCKCCHRWLLYFVK